MIKQSVDRLAIKPTKASFPKDLHKVIHRICG